MADVISGPLVVVSPLDMAFVLVSLAIVLISGIYSENLGNGEKPSEQEVVEQRALLNEDHREVADRMNAEVATTDPTAPSTNLSHAFDDYSTTRISVGARDGESIELRLQSSENGMRLRQTDESWNFTSKGRAVDWKLTGSVRDGGQLAVNVQEESAHQTTLDEMREPIAESAFGIESHLADYTGSVDGVWHVYLFRGAATESAYGIVEAPEQTFEDSNLSTTGRHCETDPTFCGGAGA